MKSSIDSIETFGLVDGPGIRTVIFFNGCPLRCLYCHNPEMWTKKKENYSVEELLKKVLRNKPYFKRNNGGVTLSGGEPLLQVDFLIEFCKELKKEGIHIALDTSGVGIGKYEEILEFVDLVIFDIKYAEKEGYKKITGREITESEKFIKCLNKSKKPVWIRQVIVPQKMDNREYLKKLATYLKKIKNIEKIEFLPFHHLGFSKYVTLEIENPLKNVEEMNKEKCDKLYQEFLKLYEKKNRNKSMKEKKTKLIILALFIAILGVIGVSYAVWQLTKTQEGTNVITSGCFKITFAGQNDILLNNAYPISDEEGKTLTPYTFTIKNECATSANYVINLETISSGEKILSEEYLKANLQQSETNLFLDTLTAKNENTEKVIPEARKAYKLYQGVLNANEEVSNDLRLWMDNDTPTIDEVMNASYEGKITVTSSFIPTEEKNLPMMQSVGSSSYTGEIWNYKNSITKIVFENTLHEIEGATASFDISYDKTDESKKVMAYLVSSGGATTTRDDEPPAPDDNPVTTNMTLYIQGTGGVSAPADSSYLFAGFAVQTIEGLENFDTRNVTNMTYMFYNCQRLTALDLRYFNTKNVEKMLGMFHGCESLTDLNVESFDTSKVTTMAEMFTNCSALEMIDLHNFDTSNVVNMRLMFQYTNLTELNLSNFNTNKLENMEGMFSGMSNLTNLDLSSFDTTNVTNMNSMFEDCTQLETTLTIRNPSFETDDLAFNGVSLTLNYTSETESAVDSYITGTPNVVKGQLIP